ncbi:Asp23/Gls24 family envelope stress response protein [Sulfobacillus sp. hq2]|uniref:Asp23/Gls24 family envelope stress response protein n=1 Tax=Sulfobacillus thermotolerans TaxID=338644 RepID=A0ABN5H159_9FIRM|nr:Asp23/Gls24 family envelope stress response protein [Sulfobacillus sp. hq2]AUW94481.1 hypothetical protein BXT84_11450 [Sulfobacillus thermotolerans]MCY0908515.1 Asp23/Gls24 family envelope stress response protein [Sulfobacillus thermotolerans]
MEVRTEYGTLAVHDDVLAAIVQSAVLAVPGVVDMGIFRVGEGLTEMVKKDQSVRGVWLEDTDQGLVIHVAVIVAYGQRIPVLGQKIVQQCSDRLAESVSMRPRRVIVEVQGVQVVKEEKAPSAS